MKIAFKYHVENNDLTAILDVGVTRTADNVDTYTTYAHVGQHGTSTADYITECIDATPEQYAPLLDELRSIYNDRDIVVVDKWKPYRSVSWDYSLYVMRYKDVIIKRGNGYYFVILSEQLHAFSTLSRTKWTITNYLNKGL